MRAIVIHPPNPGVSLRELSDINLSNIGDDEVAVRTLYTGICGTDRELANGLMRHSVPPPGKDFMVLGHEVIGEVIDVGEKVTGFKRGDKVVALVRRGCGNCLSCRLGRPDLCETGEMKIAGIKAQDGFMADLFVDKESYLVRVPDNVVSEDAVLIQPMGDVVKAIRTFLSIVEARFPWGCEDSTYECRSAAIIGSGSTGLLFSILLKSMGFNVVVLNRRAPTRLEERIVGEIGVDFRLISEDVGQIDLLVDTSGSTVSISRVISKVKPKGGVILFGFGIGDETRVSSQLITDIVYKNIVIVGSAALSQMDFSVGR
jgi:aldose 1-dehydrogenase [NAD(P)+]